MKSFRFFFSMATTGMLLLVFAVVIGTATFVENDHGTAAARALIYNAWWFEALLFVLALNLLGSVVVNKLWTKPKWPVGFFHFAFLLILAGAAVTRYYSFEGTLRIREGEASNQLISRSVFLRMEAEYQGEKTVVNHPLSLLPGSRKGFTEKMHIADKTFTVKYIGTIPNAIQVPVETPNGVPMLSLLVVDRNNQPHDVLLKKGQEKKFGSLTFRFGHENADSTDIILYASGDTMMMQSSDTLFTMLMGADSSSSLPPGSSYPLLSQAIYQAGDLGFVLKQFLPSARMEWGSDPMAKQGQSDERVKFSVTDGSETREVVLSGKAGTPGDPEILRFGDATVTLQYGSLVHPLPFALYLRDFQIERYPGSQSPSSFASEVILIDTAKNLEKPYRIFMNNILKYGGYRFFQSSYDPDEKGTVLSVNYDAPGTAVTYTGYLLMTLGMIFLLFSRQSRFRRLAASLSKMKGKAPLTVALVVLMLLPLVAFSNDTLKPAVVDPAHAKTFGLLQVQNIDGRIEPANTLASELLRKISKQNRYNGQTPLQVMLSMLADPEAWQSEPIIKVGNGEIARMLGIQGEYASFTDLLDPGQPNGYKLSNAVQQAYAREPGQRSKFDKEIINVDERINVLYKMIQTGYLAIFPVPDDSTHKWVSFSEAHSHPDRNLAVFATTAMRNYVTALQEGVQSGRYEKADSALAEIVVYQKKEGAAVYPPLLKTRLEVLYVNFNLYGKLAGVYGLLGLLLLILQIRFLLKPTGKSSLINRSGFWMVFALFLLHSSALAVRWYISGHAPWSNGYETLLYISWISCFIGLLFARRSPLALSITTLLASLSLMVAGMSWMNPELTNLVPVLKSYWLIIHVAVITASYGFLGVGALMALVNLVLMILRSPKNKDSVSHAISELTTIIHMALILGLYLLTIGSFLGGVWANESWGRYWGWDPKETWALVTILVYAFITHMHRIRGLEGIFTFNAAALVGFGSVLMTYFGVNYYLSGLHSYAAGDAPPVPAGVYIGVAALFFLILFAGFGIRHHQKQVAMQNVTNEDPAIENRPSDSSGT
ncbi:MAG TPA: cytochrome c biogenesis protein CcsA [Bacteroidales bacterium]|nr:cytochrome c biogenesis protein CcsA [Bacteroidales bacterium]HRZ49754.1 cytochrome c biogenesis protein CcsA [Bacteroidales bacterium]